MTSRTIDPADLGRFFGDGTAALIRAAPAYEVWQVPGATLALSGEPLADLNFIALAASPDPGAALREFVVRTQARHVPVLVAVSAAVADLIASVAPDLGLTRAGEMPLMTRDGAGVTAAAGLVAVGQVVSAGDLGAVQRIIARADALPEDAVARTFGPGLLDTPGVAVFLARVGERPISTMITTRHGATVGIWCMATLPEAQRAGAGRALLTQVMAQQRASGARLFYLGASEAGYPLYERMGFRTVETLSVWEAGHPTQGHG
jgi:GNAT superfamily N-acetyltransferase